MKNKISDVDKDTWIQVKGLKDEIIVERNRVRNELLQVRQEKVVDDVPPIISEEKVKAVIVQEETPLQKINETPTMRPRPRLIGKVVDVNGLKIFAGGDIIDNQELLQMERDRKNIVDNINIHDTEEININEKNMDDNNLVGIDMTDQLPDNEIYKPIQKKEPPTFPQNIREFFTKVFKVISLKKFILVFLGIVIVYIAVSFFFYTSVNISVKFKQDELSIKKSITAKPDATTPYDVATMTIKYDPVTKTNSTSSEIETTGKGQTGEYAQGQLLVVNPGVTAITIKLGQVFSYNYLATTLKYTSVVAVTIDAGSSKAISIKAESFGEKYNIDDTLKTFVPEGLSNTISAQNIVKITGGTTKEVKAVSKADIDSIKQTLLDKLKNDLTSNLKTLLSENEIILTGSEQFKEDSFTTSSKEGDIVDKFTAELKLTITAVKINKTLIKNLLQDAQKAELGYSKVTIKDPVIENVVMSGNVASFDAKANASAFNDLDLNALKQEIKGKSVTDAKEYIKSKPGVDDVIIRYSPSFIPQNFQSIPNEDGKINIIKVEN